MEQFDNTLINKEKSGKEKSEEIFKMKLCYLNTQINEVVGYLEIDLKMNYEDIKKDNKLTKKELEGKMEKDNDLIKAYYNNIKYTINILKSERLNEINKEYMSILESQKISIEEKEIARQEYLNRLEKLVSDKDFEITNQRIMQGNLNSIQRQFDNLKPSEKVTKGRSERVGGETQEEALENIKTIQNSLRATIEQSGDVTDYGLNSLAAACDVIGELILLYEAKMDIYKQKSKESIQK